MLPSADEIRHAREVLGRYLHPTPLVRARSLESGNTVHLKLESEQPTGSFKVRGALYALAVRTAHEPVREVVASSTGNHGAAVAWAAQLFGIPARIFLPAGANRVKRQRIEELQAHVVEAGRDITEAAGRARTYAASNGAYFLDDATDRHVPAGPATIAVEILESLDDVSEIYVPVGDTALIRGVAAAVKWLRPHVRIVGVQAEGAPAYALSWRERRVIATDACVTIADGLATRSPEEENVSDLVAVAAEMVLVSDPELVAAVRHLAREERVIAEPAGAAATAALLKALPRPAGSVVLLVTGSNIAPELREHALA